MSKDEGTTANSSLAKWRVTCFYDSEVLNSSFVLLMKFSAENPRLRKAAKRCPAMPPLRYGTAGQRGGDYISCCACAFANASALRTTRDLRKF